MLCKLFLPIPHIVAKGGLEAKLVVQADFNNAVNIANALIPFIVHGVGKAPLKGLNDLLLVQARAAWAPHGQHKRKAELAVVVGVELLNMCKFCWCALGQPRFALLVGGFDCERVGHHGFACQLGVGTDQTDLRFNSRVLQDFHHHMLQM